MSSQHTAPQTGEKTPSESLNVAVSFARKLDGAEELTGTPTISVSPSGLTLSAAAVSTTALTINGVSVAAGKAVQFNVSDGSADTCYTISILAETDADTPQTVQGFITLCVVSS